MRPTSYRYQIPAKCCGNCKYSATPEYKDDLLCIYGDTLIKCNLLDDGKYDLEIGSQTIGLMDGDEYDKIWGGRVVDFNDICDEWESVELIN
jgi:hypothetical protein